MEFVDIMVNRKINILCIQETKWVGEKAKEIDSLGFKLWYSGRSRTRNGVGVIIDKSLKDNVVEIKRIDDSIIALKIVVDTKIINVISVYAPQVGLNICSKKKFWNDLEGLIQMIPLEEKIFIGGDLNGHVGRVVEDFKNIHGGYEFGVTNEEGRTILDFALAYDFAIANTLFKKREEHIITYKNGSISLFNLKRMVGGMMTCPIKIPWFYLEVQVS